MQFTDVQQVCFIRIGAVGDLLVATAALEETLQRFPNSHVWVAGPALWKSLLLPSRWPRINGIIDIDKKGFGRLCVPNLQNETWEPQGEGQYLQKFLTECDASVNLRPESLRLAWPAFFARVPIRIGTCWWGTKWLFTHWSPWVGKDPIIHERDRMLRIATATQQPFFPLGFTRGNRQRMIQEQTQQTGKEKAERYMVIQPGQAKDTPAYQWRNKVLPQLKVVDKTVAQDLTHTENYVLINPTASRIEKAWPAEKFRELALNLQPWLRERGHQLFIIGSPTETEWLKKVAGPEIPIVQPANLRILMDVVGPAKAVLTNTSSLQFIANSLRAPTVTLMGRTFPARWGPLAPTDLTICGKLPSPPLADVFAEDYTAYNSISVETVERQFKDWFQNKLVGSQAL